MSLNKKYFGTDGIRGRANVHPMSPEFVLRLGKAVGACFRRDHRESKIVIGKDTRLSGYMIESALTSGICSMGAEVHLLGPMPTPAVAYLTGELRADAGIVISASHNPFDDNGIKFFGPDGRKLPDEVEAAIERDMEEPAPEGPTGDGIGKAYRVDDAEGRYLAHAKAAVDAGLNLKGITLVVDCANGSGYEVAPTLFREMGARVVTLGCDPDGKNINHGCGSTEPGLMAGTVSEVGAHAGVALDGDADRAVMADEKGRILDGDDVLYIMSGVLKERGALPGDTVVGTEMSNVGLEAALRERGFEFRRAPVGDRYVLEEMLACGAAVGGEPSGHVIFLDHAPTGDGIVTALRVIQVMAELGRPLSGLASGWERCPQVMRNLPVTERVPLEDQGWYEDLISEARRLLGEPHILSVRYSGTEPVLRVTVSGVTRSAVSEVSHRLCRALAEKLDLSGRDVPLGRAGGPPNGG